MASYNRVILVGNMTRDPELRTIPSGMSVTDIGLAVNDRRKDANGNYTEETTFVDITFWGRNAEIVAEYARKGTQILVEGRLKLDTWEAEGQKRSKLKVVGELINLMGRPAFNKYDGASSGGGYNRPPQGYNNTPAGQGYNDAYGNSNPAAFQGGNANGNGYDSPGPARDMPDDDIPF